MTTDWHPLIYGKVPVADGARSSGFMWVGESASIDDAAYDLCTPESSKTEIGLSHDLEWGKYPWIDSPGAYSLRSVLDANRVRHYVALRCNARREIANRLYAHVCFLVAPATDDHEESIPGLLDSVFREPLERQDNALPDVAPPVCDIALPDNWRQLVEWIVPAMACGRSVGVYMHVATPDEFHPILMTCRACFPAAVRRRLPLGLGLYTTTNMHALAHGVNIESEVNLEITPRGELIGDAPDYDREGVRYVNSVLSKAGNVKSVVQLQNVVDQLLPDLCNEDSLLPEECWQDSVKRVHPLIAVLSGLPEWFADTDSLEAPPVFEEYARLAVPIIDQHWNDRLPPHKERQLVELLNMGMNREALIQYVRAKNLPPPEVPRSRLSCFSNLLGLAGKFDVRRYADGLERRFDLPEWEANQAGEYLKQQFVAFRPEQASESEIKSWARILSHLGTGVHRWLDDWANKNGLLLAGAAWGVSIPLLNVHWADGAGRQLPREVAAVVALFRKAKYTVADVDTLKAIVSENADRGVDMCEFLWKNRNYAVSLVLNESLLEHHGLTRQPDFKRETFTAYCDEVQNAIVKNVADNWSHLQHPDVLLEPLLILWNRLEPVKRRSIGEQVSFRIGPTWTSVLLGGEYSSKQHEYCPPGESVAEKAYRELVAISPDVRRKAIHQLRHGDKEDVSAHLFACIPELESIPEEDKALHFIRDTHHRAVEKIPNLTLGECQMVMRAAEALQWGPAIRQPLLEFEPKLFRVGEYRALAAATVRIGRIPAMSEKWCLKLLRKVLNDPDEQEFWQRYVRSAATTDPLNAEYWKAVVGFQNGVAALNSDEANRLSHILRQLEPGDFGRYFRSGRAIPEHMEGRLDVYAWSDITSAECYYELAERLVDTVTNLPQVSFMAALFIRAKQHTNVREIFELVEAILSGIMLDSTGKSRDWATWREIILHVIYKLKLNADEVKDAWRWSNMVTDLDS